MRDKNKITGSILAVLFLCFTCIVLIKNVRVPLSVARNIYKGSSIEAAISNVESDFNGSFPWKTVFVDANGLAHRVFQQNIMAGVVRLENGHITQTTGRARDDVLNYNAQKLTEFAKWFASEKGGNTIYVQAPWKISKYDDLLPAGVEDYNNDNADRFLTFLGEEVGIIDLRATMHEAGINSYDCFLKTEHHWNAYGGFHAFQELCKFMTEQYGDQIDPAVLDLSNYEQVIPEESSMGYYGQKTGAFFAGYDEYPLIYPKFETKQTCTIPHKEVVRSGSFYDAVFDMSAFGLEKRSRGLYGTYIGGDYPLVIHHSETAKNPGTIMILIDSYGTIPEAFLTTAYQNVIAIDLRWVLRCGWEETTVDFINMYEPETVVVMLNLNQLIWQGSEQFEFGVP